MTPEAPLVQLYDQNLRKLREVEELTSAYALMSIEDRVNENYSCFLKTARKRAELRIF